jgi:hypothetical protein
MAETVEIRGGTSAEEIAFKLLYAVAWSENIDLEGWAKTDRKWILDSYAECLQTVKDPAARLAQAAARKPATA